MPSQGRPRIPTAGNCSVFEAFSLAVETGRRLDRLTLGLSAAFQPMKVELIESEDERSQWAPRSYTAHFKAPGLRPRRKAPGHIAVHFDLARPGLGQPAWPWARTALVVVAYGLNYDQGWTGAQLTVRSDGRLAYEAEAEMERFAEGRLLTTAEPPPGAGWVETEWAYALPLSILTPETLKAQIADPVTALLVLGHGPDQALAGSDAVAWAA
jgi:hypothetical protein